MDPSGDDGFDVTVRTPHRHRKCTSERSSET
ncbi:MAG: hypothetical protein C4335_06935 [Armatimonadota bacterium]